MGDDDMPVTYAEAEEVLGLGKVFISSTVDGGIVWFFIEPGVVAKGYLMSLSKARQTLLSNNKSYWDRYRRGEISTSQIELVEQVTRMHQGWYDAATSRCVTNGVPPFFIEVNQGLQLHRVPVAEWTHGGFEVANEGVVKGRFVEAARLYELLAQADSDREQAYWRAAVASLAAGDRRAAEANLANFRLSATPKQLEEAKGAIQQLEGKIASLGVGGDLSIRGAQ